LSTRRWIIVTTINSPTAAIHQIAKLAPEWTLLVIGDRKTPKDWHCEGATFLSIEEQRDLGFTLSRDAPFNHYARKNLGYLYAIEKGADLLLETDDDNFPYDWYPGDTSGTVRGRLIRKAGWENVYTHFTKNRIWPRGFPLERINESLRQKSELGGSAEYDCVIQQFLANENPDVDAVFRLTNELVENFEGEDVVLGPGTWCPFNSQNTLWRPAAFICLYLPFTASFRMTDIWRSFVAQTCVHALNGNVAFRGASMYQQRNEHSLIKDFADEVSGYLNNDSIMTMLSALRLKRETQVGVDLRQCYEAMVAAGYLRSEEMGLVECWVEDYQQARQKAEKTNAF
jgi:hypothetical protein